jgi:hypothetical protein
LRSFLIAIIYEHGNFFIHFYFLDRYQIMDIPDKLLINLKIISKIQKNGRIARSNDGLIHLETDTFYKSIKRLLNSDSRQQSLLEINSIITESMLLLLSFLNSKNVPGYNDTHYSPEITRNLENIELLIYLIQEAINGIVNLQFTYSNDTNTSIQIDIILLKINNILKDTNNRLSSLNIKNIQICNETIITME